MASRADIHAVLHNFLGTFISRYTNYQGYWLFGFLVPEIDRIEIDLLQAARTPDTASAMEVTVLTATEKFREQALKAGVMQWIQTATLTIEKLAGTVQMQIEAHEMTAYSLSLTARATSDLGRDYTHSRTIYVAPHSSVERRSV